jgi:hypothetical protein
VHGIHKNVKNLKNSVYKFPTPPHVAHGEDTLKIKLFDFLFYPFVCPLLPLLVQGLCVSAAWSMEFIKIFKI